MNRAVLCSLAAVALMLSSCRQDMYNQPKAKTYSQSDFFADGASARPLPNHTVEYHGAHENEAYYTGLSDGVLVAEIPAPVMLTPELLRRGQERYNIYCSVCHGLGGIGNGEVVQRGYPAPPSYHSERLRNAPLGHFYDVITNGYGTMYSYASRVEPNDRWAIAAYIRALQLSQHASTSDFPPAERNKQGAKP